MPRYRSVLFDLDGTLVDSNPLILASFHSATEDVLGRRFPDERITALIGGGSAERQMATLDPDRVGDLVQVYRTHSHSAYDHVACFEGIVEVLEALRRRGARLAVVSAKPRATVERAFAAVSIAGFFDVIVGADATTRHKPDPAPLLLALEKLGSAPADAAYVGDSPYDVEAARAAGVFAVAVAWGGLHRVEDADAFVERPEELLAVL